MTPISTRAILVTGSHRSGTGWVGQVLAASPRPIGYVWEPFSILHRPGICSAHFDRWFPYVCHENEESVFQPMAATLDWKYATGAEIKSLRSPKDAARMARDAARFRRYRHQHAIPLLKDPIAIFSVEWLCSTFAADPVLLVRHPAAFAASIKRLHLRHPFEDFLAQPLMMRDWLGPFADDILRFADHEQDIVDQAILLWNVIHHAIVTYRNRHPEWPVLRLEDLSRNPIPKFHVLFQRLGIPYNDAVDAVIRDTTNASNPAEASTMDSVKRDSAAHIWNWKRTLTLKEITRVRSGTSAIADQFYGQKDW